MKKTLTLLALNLLPLISASAQNPSSVPNIKALEALGLAGAKAPQVNVKDFGNGHGGGGTFVYNGSACSNGGAGDDGTQFPAQVGCWHRQVLNNEIDPLMFGAAGNGTTDDTAQLHRFFAALNAGPYNGNGLKKTYEMQYVASGYANLSRSGLSLHDFTLLGKPGTGANTRFLNISGSHVTLTNVTVDGNMPHMTSSSNGATYCMFVDVPGDYQIWNNVTVKNCNSQSALLFGMNGAPSFTVTTGHMITSLQVSGNSGTGLEVMGTTSSSFTNARVNNNGYGYKVLAPYPINRSNLLGTDVGFNAAFRFETHDIQISNSQFNNGGKDGLNFNQGAHNIVVTNTEANFNGDGGFTFAADNTASGYPGNGQSPSNIRLLNDMAQGNYTDGVAAYSAISGLSVIGGKYWNNSRVEGDIPQTSSYFNDIYISADSRDTYVKTSAYDDRQTATVTSSGSCTFMVNHWSLGTYRNYPKVGFYSASGAFEGYAQISAESSSRLTVTTLPYDSVKCAGISPGWMVTQRVTHNGVFLDKGSTGQLDVVGSGFLIGPNPAIQGHVELKE